MGQAAAKQCVYLKPNMGIFKSYRGPRSRAPPGASGHVRVVRGTAASPTLAQNGCHKHIVVVGNREKKVVALVSYR